MSSDDILSSPLGNTKCKFWYILGDYIRYEQKHFGVAVDEPKNKYNKKMGITMYISTMQMQIQSYMYVHTYTLTRCGIHGYK